MQKNDDSKEGVVPGVEPETGSTRKMSDSMRIQLPDPNSSDSENEGDKPSYIC